MEDRYYRVWIRVYAPRGSGNGPGNNSNQIGWEQLEDRPQSFAEACELAKSIHESEKDVEGRQVYDVGVLPGHKTSLWL